MIQTGQSGIRAYVLADIVYPIGNADPPSRGSVFFITTSCCPWYHLREHVQCSCNIGRSCLERAHGDHRIHPELTIAGECFFWRLRSLH